MQSNIIETSIAESLNVETPNAEKLETLFNSKRKTRLSSKGGKQKILKLTSLNPPPLTSPSLFSSFQPRSSTASVSAAININRQPAVDTSFLRSTQVSNQQHFPPLQFISLLPPAVLHSVPQQENMIETSSFSIAHPITVTQTHPAIIDERRTPPTIIHPVKNVQSQQSNIDLFLELGVDVEERDVDVEEINAIYTNLETLTQFNETNKLLSNLSNLDEKKKKSSIISISSSSSSSSSFQITKDKKKKTLSIKNSKQIEKETPPPTPSNLTRNPGEEYWNLWKREKQIKDQMDSFYEQIDFFQRKLLNLTEELKEINIKKKKLIY